MSDTNLIEEEAEDPNAIDLTVDPVDNGIDVSPAVKSKIPAASVVSERTKKYDFALGENSPGAETISAELTSGNEDLFRHQKAIEYDAAALELKNNIALEFMEQRKGQVTQEDVQVIDALASAATQKTDPKVFMEREYARRIAEAYLSSASEESELQKTLDEDPETAHGYADAIESITTRKELYQRQLEKLEAQREETGTLSAIGQTLVRFVPLYDSIQLMNELKAAKPVSWLPGSNLAEQLDYIHLQPPERAGELLKELTDSLASSNIYLALEVAGAAVAGLGSSGVTMYNVFGALDIADVIPIVTAGKVVKAISKAGKTKQTAKTAAKEVANEVIAATVKGRTTEASEVAAATGRLDVAAVLRLAEEPVSEVNDMGKRMKHLQSRLPSIFDVQSVFAGPIKLASISQKRIMETLARTQGLVLEAVTNKMNVLRLGDNALQEALKLTEKSAREEFQPISYGIMDITPTRKELTNTDAVEVKFGDHNALLFERPEGAKAMATDFYQFKDSDFEIKSQSGKYYISVTRDINETDDAVREVMIDTLHTTPDSVWNYMFGWFKTPEDTLSMAQRQARHTATHGQNIIRETAIEIAKPLQEVFRSKESKKKLLQFIDHSHETEKFYNNISDIENAWLKQFNRLPSEKEIAGYASYIQISDFDYMLRNLNMYTEKSRLGAKNVSFKFQSAYDENGLLVELNQQANRPHLWTKEIEAVKVDNIPFDDVEDIPFALLNENTGVMDTHFTKSSGFTPELRQIIEEQLKNGYSVYQVFSPKFVPLSQYTGNRVPVRFVIAKTAKQSNLNFTQIEYKAGGHRKYLYEHTVKQAQTYKHSQSGKTFYTGDNVAFMFRTAAEAAKYSKIMERARLLLKDVVSVSSDGSHMARAQKAAVELKEYIAKNLPMSHETFTKLFEPKVDPKTGRILAQPRFNIEQPFVNLREGQKTRDVHAIDAVDDTQSKYNLMDQVNKEFTETRADESAWTINESKPVLSIQPAPRVDVMSVMSDAINTLSRGSQMNDYKIFSAETFISEFGDMLRVDPALLRDNPIKHLMDPVWKSSTEVTSPEKLRAAKNAHRAIVELMGQRSTVGDAVKHLKEKINSFVYEKAGQKYSALVDDHLLGNVKDPLRFARSVAFHSFLGLFNPIQLFLQMQSLTHVAAVAGVGTALKSIPAAVMFRMLRFNPSEANIKHFAKMYTGMTGEKAEYFIESYNLLNKVGLHHVEGEVGVLNDYIDPTVFRSTVGKVFLDKGKFFFTEGERLARFAGWHAAYVEARSKSSKKLTERDIQAILVRANDLNLNQTRASVAQWQTGIAAPMTQFWGYQARMMEQFLGKRVMKTPQEKLYAFGVYSAMYGIPVGTLGTAAGFYPWAEDIRQGLIERGINPDEDVMAAFHNGLPAWILKGITGEDYNVNQRYGPGGLPFIKEVMSGEKNFIDIFMGASGSVSQSFLKNLDPALFTAGRVFSGDLEQFPVLGQDVAQMFKDISTVSLASRIVTALNTGKLVTKNEIVLTDATSYDILLSAIGLTPRTVSDTFSKINSLSGLTAQQQEHEKRAILYFKRGLQAANDRNDTLREAYFTRATLEMAAGAFLPAQRKDALSKALKGNENLVETIDWQFVQKMGAKPEGKAILDQFIKGQK